jgi:hypothetical protein
MPSRRDSDNVVALLPGDRAPAPPSDLSEREAAVWRDTVGSEPARWFTAEKWPVLRGYCRAVVAADSIWPQYERALKTPGIPFKTIDRLSRMFDAETNGIRRAASDLGLLKMARVRVTRAPRYQARPWEG